MNFIRLEGSNHSSNPADACSTDNQQDFPRATNMGSSPAWEQVRLAAKLADLKEEHYRTVLTLSAMLELFVDKGLLTQEELDQKSATLDRQLEELISASLHPMG
ncbi:hypothetical protein [Paenibacillus chungangensis]|uniref:Uncharacterized protein n=1 Tax=Paenibacillus chungangensis TaxID=696535 RepID=A0ABW3HWC9_9BACL